MLCIRRWLIDLAIAQRRTRETVRRQLFGRRQSRSLVGSRHYHRSLLFPQFLALHEHPRRAGLFLAEIISFGGEVGKAVWRVWRTEQRQQVRGTQAATPIAAVYLG